MQTPRANAKLDSMLRGLMPSMRIMRSIARGSAV